MPGVLIVEAMAQVAGVLVLSQIPDRERKLVFLAGQCDEAKFRQAGRSGDQLRIEVNDPETLRPTVAKMQRHSDGRGVVVAEAESDVHTRRPQDLAMPFIRPQSSMRRREWPQSADIGPYCVIGADVEIGAGTR